MTLAESMQIIEVIRSKYKFYGISTTFLDNNVYDLDDYLIYGRLGLAVIESVERPADAYYIQHVVFPAFVKRVFPPERGIVVDSSFEYQLHQMMEFIPNFYQDIITWPASTL